MTDTQRTISRKRIVLIAHDNRKPDLITWARDHRDLLARHALYATGSTGRLLAQELDLPIVCFQRGPLGGDLQVGSRIVEGDVDMLVFFWDPLEPHPHDPDVKALLRVAVLWNIPTACNRSTADLLVSSPWFSEGAQEEIEAAQESSPVRLQTFNRILDKG
ncbi:MAG: methylglyoxal synthase [Armatimonadetes bacterium]|nr:methylglyoxal synthase [Armatimonadota bacterium]MDW8154590.1 methylglyoxal synthase [Armatimonadota bacterium]